MKAWPWLIVAAVAAAALASGPARAGEGPPAPVWAPLDDRPGLILRRGKERSYATAATRTALDIAADVAASYGGALQVADVSGPVYGAVFPPHKSHRTGADADVGYELTTYSTPLNFFVAEGFVAILAALAPRLDRVFVSAQRSAEIQAIAASKGWPLPQIIVWPGHETHAHLRFAP